MNSICPEVFCEIIKNLEHDDLRSLSIVSKRFNYLINYCNSSNVQNFHLRNIQSLMQKNTSETLILNILKKPSLGLYEKNLSYLCETALERNLILVTLYFLKKFNLENYKNIYEKAFIYAASRCDFEIFKKLLKNEKIILESHILTEAFLRALCRKDDSNEIINVLLASNKIKPNKYNFELGFDEIIKNNQFEILKILMENNQFKQLAKELLPIVLSQKIFYLRMNFLKQVFENFKFTECELKKFFTKSIKYDSIEISYLFHKNGIFNSNSNSNSNYFNFALKKSIKYGNYSFYKNALNGENINREDLGLIFKNAIMKGKCSSLKYLIHYEKENLRPEDLKIALKIAVKYEKIKIITLLLEKFDYSSEELKDASQLAFSKNKILHVLKDHYAIKRQYEKQVYFKMVFEAIKWLITK